MLRIAGKHHHVNSHPLPSEIKMKKEFFKSIKENVMKKIILLTFIPILLFAGGVSFNGRLNLDYTLRPERKDSINPSSTFRVNLSGGINFYGINAGINLFFNSDDKFTPQTSSFYSLTPAWSWGRIYIGDFAPSFSNLTLSGVSIRGGGLELFPGPFKLFVVSGESKRSVNDSTGNGFTKYIWGIKLGLGRETGTSIAILNARDIPSSLPDSLRDGMTPEENWVAELQQKVSLFKGRFTILMDGALSLLTRNIYATPISDNNIPDWAASNFNVNLSSNSDYAYRIESRLRTHRFSLNFAHAYIGPGFESHGLPGINNDRIEEKAGINISLGRYGSMGANGSYSHDNLIDLNEAETRNTVGNFFLTLVPSRILVLTSYTMLSKMDRNSSQNDTLELTNTSVSTSVSTNLRLSKKINAGISASLSNTEVQTVIKNTEARVVSFNARINHKFSRIFSYSLTGGVVKTTSDTLEETSITPGVNFSFTPGRKFRLRVGVRSGISENKTMVSFSARSVLKLTPKDAISIKVTSENYIKPESNPNSLTIKLSYGRGFGKRIF